MLEWGKNKSSKLKLKRKPKFVTVGSITAAAEDTDNKPIIGLI
jgi:hypothetical protein